MPAAFSGKRPGRRRLPLLLLLCLTLSGGSPAALTVTTEDTSQSLENSLTKMHAGFNESSPALLGPGLTRQGQLTKEDESVVTFGKYEILLPGDSQASMERHITLHSATEIELSCKLGEKYSHMENPQVSWTRGSETIPNVNKVGNSWSIQLKVLDSSKLGSYSCNLEGEEISSVVHLQLPKIYENKKPIISYEGDTAVMICKSHDYTPLSWTWYMTNGSEQVPINDSLPDKYVVDRIPTNVTHLKIIKVTEEDDGVYWCEAAFNLGKSKGKQQLIVLSFLVPLKPFLGVVGEVVFFLTVVFLYELYSKRKANAEKQKKKKAVRKKAVRKKAVRKKAVLKKVRKKGVLGREKINFFRPKVRNREIKGQLNITILKANRDFGKGTKRSFAIPMPPELELFGVCANLLLSQKMSLSHRCLQLFQV
ncbi:embigin [Phaethornis superciliosus]